MKKNVAIIGAGLTGLTTAYYLKKAGIPFHIFEKSENTGGVIRSEKKAGFIFEKGPNTGVVANLELARLLEDLAKTIRVVYADETAQKRLIWKKQQWHALPSGLFSAVFTPLFTTKDKLKVAGEYFRKRGNSPTESLAETVERRLGKSFLDYAIDPFVSGVYAGDPQKLITKYAFPKLYNLEEKYGGFIKGSIKINKERSEEFKKKVNKKIFSFETGLQELTDELTKRIGKENFSLNQKDLEVKYVSSHNFLIDNRNYTHVISTINANAIKKSFSFIDSEIIQKITSLVYAPVVEISIGFDKWQGLKLDAFGGLIPTKEKKNILGVLFISSQFPNRAPKGGAFFSVFMGGTRKREFINLTDEELIKILEKDFKKLMQLENFSPDLLEISRHPQAIAQYSNDTPLRLEAIGKAEKTYPGLLIKGSVKDGIGIADRVAQAFNTAQLIQKV